MSSIHYSEVESKRFGKEIFRGDMDVLDIELLKEFYQANDPDVLILRLPVTEQHKMYQLNTLGKEVINADTLVYYCLDMRNAIYHAVGNKELVFAEAGISDKNIFERLIPEIFTNYTTHYFSNPLLDKKKITEGYIEWAVNSINAPGHHVFLVYTGDIPIGFITGKHNSDFAEIILNGVLPEYQGRGVYTDMIRYVKSYYKRLQIPAIKVSTQIQNFAVQKVWNREGFVLSNAYVTIHLNKKNS